MKTQPLLSIPECFMTKVCENVGESFTYIWGEPERAPTLTGCLVLVAMVYRTSILASGVLGTKFICTCHTHAHRVDGAKMSAAR